MVDGNVSGVFRTWLRDKYRHAREVLAESAGPVDPWSLVVRDLMVHGIHSILTVDRDADGTVRFSGQDLGVPAGLVSNDTEYEYFRTIRPRRVPQLVELLGGRPGDELRDLLGLEWADGRSFELEKRLGQAPFPIEFVSC